MTEVNSFWHGPDLTALERMCISSFLANGIRYNLYVYDLPANVPEGVTIRDASEILPRSRIFKYKAGTFNVGSIAGFTNLFRYTLIHSHGGWWTDIDVCCLKKLAKEEPEVFFSESSQNGDFLIGTALFKSPANSAVTRHCLEVFANKNVDEIVHGETGPSLFTEAVAASGRERMVQDGSIIFPVPWWEYNRLFYDESLPVGDGLAVHFWNAMVDAAGLDKNGTFPQESVFETLKRKYL